MQVGMTSAVFSEARYILLGIGVREKEISHGIKLTVVIFDKACLIPIKLIFR